jgi:phosphoribosylformimino-5-aminoimidazole carboxamide ribotide isomerase
MDLFCAVDVRGGGAVRLEQGDFGREKGYGDPVELAKRYVAAGAPWLHVVDLDAARSGVPANRGTVLAIARTAGVPVQTGGGVRSAHDAEALLAGGIARVVVGTAAWRSPGLLGDMASRWPGRIVLGLDHRGPDRRVEISGWELDGGLTLQEALDRVASLPLAAVVVTSIETDGTMSGPDLDGLQSVLASTPHPLVASGGVRSERDLRDLGDLEAAGRRIAGVIVGKALAEGALRVEDALSACTRGSRGRRLPAPETDGGGGSMVTGGGTA